jgi:hypothetical protein
MGRPSFMYSSKKNNGGSLSIIWSKMCEQVEMGGAALMCDQEQTTKCQGNSVERMVLFQGE